MTLSELQALTDEELISRIAVEVMGWKKVTRPTQSGYGTYEGWDRGHGSYIHPCREWRPLTDWNHTMEVVEKVKYGKKFGFILDGNDIEWSATFFEPQEQDDGPVWHEDIEHGWSDDNPQRAILYAALLALQ